MEQLLLVGGGKIGVAIADFLGSTNDYAITVADQSEASLDRMPSQNVRKVKIDVADGQQLRQTINGAKYVVSAVPHTVTHLVAEAASDCAAHYFDLTEDVACTRRVKQLAQESKSALMPQCGLAPGFISIAAADLCRKFDSLRSVRMRVGALPLNPTNALKYNLTWSTDGLVNEYLNPCEAVLGGRLTEIPPLEGLESFSLDGVEYEAFNTSGGLGTLAETLDGKVETLTYKTVRYPGHRDIIKILAEDLRLGQHRELFMEILERAIPMTKQDVVLIFVSVTGMKDGRLTEETFVRKVYAGEINGQLWSAIQITTASGICAAVDLMREGKLPTRGFVRQEQVKLEDFLSNRFGRNYDA